jgi:Rieske Fe-S protein
MENCNEKEVCGNRREFLIKTAMIAGGVVLTLSNARNIFAADSEEITIVIDEKSKLNKVGGSETVKSKGSGKILVIRTGETEFKAISAKCTHSGGPVKYNSESKKASCGWHDSVFELDGKVVSGPAKSALAVFVAESKENSVVVKVS